MANELKLKICRVCGRVVEVSGDETVECCGKPMEDVVPNTVVKKWKILYLILLNVQ